MWSSGCLGRSQEGRHSVIIQSTTSTLEKNKKKKGLAIDGLARERRRYVLSSVYQVAQTKKGERERAKIRGRVILKCRKDHSSKKKKFLNCQSDRSSTPDKFPLRFLSKMLCAHICIMYTCMESVVHFASLRVVPIYRKERHNALYVMRAHVFWEKKKKKERRETRGSREQGGALWEQVIRDSGSVLLRCLRASARRRRRLAFIIQSPLSSIFLTKQRNKKETTNAVCMCVYICQLTSPISRRGQNIWVLDV